MLGSLIAFLWSVAEYLRSRREKAMKIAVLLSGTGRTLDNFHERIMNGTMKGRIEVVISNVADVLGLTKAENYGYPAFYAKDNESANAVLADYDIDIICLAGYLKLYNPPPNLKYSVLNIHPALIPSFCGPGLYGMRVHRAVHDKGVKVTGCTVHFANEIYDDGPIVVQKCVSLTDKDRPEDIASKVFEAECEAYPEAINLVHEKGVEYFWT
ncbi:MAG: formyltransferase family protein [Thermodesulfobacteriota bacterium]|nr:formyltransferase family protein [Thermodesulfobacteriota bacterium]